MEKSAMTHPQFRTVIAAALLGALLSSSTAFERVYSQTAQGTWTIKSPLPTVRAEVAAVALEGKLHALGGVFNGASEPYHDQYDPATDKWQPATPLPKARDHLAVAVANGKIYAVGGFATPVHKDASNEA